MGEFRVWLEVGQGGDASATTVNSLGGFMRDFQLPYYSPVGVPGRGILGRRAEDPPAAGRTRFKCRNCKEVWDYRDALGRPFSCPRCGSLDFREIAHG